METGWIEEITKGLSFWNVVPLVDGQDHTTEEGGAGGGSAPSDVYPQVSGPATS